MTIVIEGHGILFHNLLDFYLTLFQLLDALSLKSKTKKLYVNQFIEQSLICNSQPLSKSKKF